MSKFWIIAFVFIFVCGATLFAQDAAEKDKASKETTWLQKFVGEWEADASGTKVIEMDRMLGPWLVADIKVAIASQPIQGMLTVGYDPTKKKYVGTWIDSKTNYLWIYEGTVDSTGNALTLETEGPNSMVPGKMSKAKDVHTFTDNDHRTLTSSMLGDDGKWHIFQTVNYRRTK
jgi:hypothetical protein